MVGMGVDKLYDGKGAGEVMLGWVQYLSAGG